MTELSIESLAYGGDAVAHLDDGRAAFVRGGCPGDLVDAEIVEDHGRFVRAEVRHVLTPSPDRVEAPCPYFGVCGGCSWQHVSAGAQLAAKRQAVVDALTRIGRIASAEEIVAQTVASPREYGYRNKIELVARTGVGGLRLGYHKAGSDDLVPIDSCLLLPPKLQKAPKALSGALRYLSGGQDLGLRRVALRVAANTRDVEIALWTEPGPFPRQAASTTLGRALRSSSIVRVLVKGTDKERKVAGVEVLSGSGFWRERLSGHTMTVSAPSFFQVNTAAAEALIGLALEALEADGSDRVVDLYAGAGTFTLPLAEVAGDVVAVEAASSAVRDLRRNLEDNQVWADVVGGDALRELREIGAVDSLLVDPPRSGLAEGVVEAIAQTRARTVAYISCDPATLARDAKALADAGYGLVSATPVDLFPQTYHVETVARFVRG
ncbi:MAG TPA: 23S rRNA (uracil(1939)-C(5))-methyltransferase RlmD [Coriobacteriia bacterium]